MACTNLMVSLILEVDHKQIFWKTYVFEAHQISHPPPPSYFLFKSYVGKTKISEWKLGQR